MAEPLTSPANNAKLDANQYPSTTVVTGTAGTSDTSGTAAVLRVGGDPTTGAMYVYNLAPAASVTTSEAAANNTFGTSGSIADGATGTLVNFTSGTSFKLKGFSATGEGQGYFALQIGVGTTKYSGYTSVANKVAQVILPNPDAVPSSTVVQLLVTNQNGDTRNFEGVILGE